ncbi:cyclin-like protein [Penicillium atrosanguineum]|nr:cyclin-like protein [Penicillium atrosanguineum]KAJ5290592.1 cyclin-like protein [Penicillium atrosanguineum]
MAHSGNSPYHMPSLENRPEYTFSDEDPSNRPPYSQQPLDEFGEIKWRAHCQCGKVSYKLRRERPLKAKFCHCRGCQVMHGAPFQWAAIFPKEDVRFDNGTSGLSFYAAREKNTKYQTPTKVSCSICRTPIMDEGRNMCLIFPQLIDFSHSPEEQRERISTFLPSCHIFYELRLRDIHDGIPKWKGIDEESEHLDDSGKPLEDSGE